jgi:hypothetical protein
MSTQRQLLAQQRSRGAALITSLVLLTVLTLLSISVMSTSRLQMTMASNVQTSNNAFQLAESAVDSYMARVASDVSCFGTSTAAACDVADENVDPMKGTRSISNRFVEEIPGCQGDSGQGNSVDGTTAFHFVAEATGASDYRGGTATHTQGWLYCRLN